MTKGGRYSDFEKEVILRKTLGLWKGRETLRFGEIHRKLVDLGIVSKIEYKGTTSKILKRLVEEGYLEKVGRGKYRLKVYPKPFQITEIIKEIWEKHGDRMIYEWRTGGIFWTLAEGEIFGVPQDIDKNPVYRWILGILLMRIARIFNAIAKLGMVAENQSSLNELSLPEEALREYVLELIPYVLGEHSGIDWDGLPTEDIAKVYCKICGQLPEKINGQPILKELLREYVKEAQKLLFAIKANKLSKSSLEDLGKLQERRKIVLVVHPPRFRIDKKEDERELYRLIKASIEEGDSDATLLAHMKLFDEDVVKSLRNYLELEVGKERTKKLLKLYKLAKAGEILEDMIGAYLLIKTRKDKIECVSSSGVIKQCSKEEILNKMKEKLMYFRKHGYALRDMIKGIWLSMWPRSGPADFELSCDEIPQSEKDFMKNIVKEVLEKLKVETPRDTDSLIEEGHKLMKNLDKMLKKDAVKWLSKMKKRKSLKVKEDETSEPIQSSGVGRRNNERE